MKARILSLLIAGTLFLAHAPFALAQTSSDGWSAVQAVASDERLIVKLKNGKIIEGKMIEANDANLSISGEGKVVNILRSDIQRIQHSTGKASKAKWAAIGAGIGAGAGAGIGATKYSSRLDDSEIWISGGLLLGTAAGALTGLAIGASKRHRTLIYEAR